MRGHFQTDWIPKYLVSKNTQLSSWPEFQSKYNCFYGYSKTNLQCTYVHPTCCSLHSNHKQYCIPPSLKCHYTTGRPVEFVTMFQYTYWNSHALIYCFTKEDFYAKTRVKYIVILGFCDSFSHAHKFTGMVIFFYEYRKLCFGF